MVIWPEYRQPPKIFYANCLTIPYLRINQVQFLEIKLSGGQIDFPGVKNTSIPDNYKTGSG